MIAESYDIITDNPTKRIYEAVKKIPKGCVATYAQAKLLMDEGVTVIDGLVDLKKYQMQKVKSNELF